MIEKKPTHRAYCTKRVSRTAVMFLECGTGRVSEDGKGFDVHLDRVPVGGFNGFIRLRPLHEPQEAVITDDEE
jgi:hypothetical protein